ncbi:hypothetical protein CFC21_112317 [Triticum aestivum]|uniref:COBRA C-terminal domain-containing protein n=3 Tax=Triticum TaxID=4564 RepID=A0A9R1JF26_WHEAT|nr:hypothetical protein CFC21_029036 [Triticum aestivum]MBC2899484.1 hypothetical protein [Triticum aestivum]VAH71778.1 unnamed protein product [Triticum turgidum subsp. durum]
MTWTVMCTYSRQLASRYPTCCVSFSSYNSTIVPCGCGPHKSTGSRGGKSHGDGCIAGDPKKDGAQLLQCTNHMCPIRVHWHVKLNYKDYWRAEIAVTNFNYRMNYTQWTLVAQHSNLNNVSEVFSFQYKPFFPYGNINDTGMFYGLKLYNDQLMEPGPFGNVQSEVLMRKDDTTFTFSQGRAFPRKIYFNGNECKMPPPESYPYLLNSTPPRSSIVTAASTCLMLLLLLPAS